MSSERRPARSKPGQKGGRRPARAATLAELKPGEDSARGLVMAGSVARDLSDDEPAPAAGSREVVIEARGVGKCYEIYAKPSDRLKQALLRHKRTFFTPFWAVREVDLEVRRGEAVGILGRNGAGKSTLLQVVAGIMRPTEGTVTHRGRVAALLELGSGFNPEFSGRENVYMNASILGIPRRQMDERFADVEAFAEIGDFIDRPVKTYSSGMKARLAFAVNIAVDPDVLIVDEILSVGDMGFQSKCMARLRKMREDGLTMLYVSHSAEQVRSICDRGLVLAQGRSAFFGPSAEAVKHYLALVRSETSQRVLDEERSLAEAQGRKTHVPAAQRFGSGQVQVQRVEILDEKGEPARAVGFGRPMRVAVTVLCVEPMGPGLSVSYLVRDAVGVELTGTTTFDEGVALPELQAGQSLTVEFEMECLLRKGPFGLSVAVHRVCERDYSDNIVLDQVDGCAAFRVVRDVDRPVHYKFHQPVSIAVRREDGEGETHGR